MSVAFVTVAERTSAPGGLNSVTLHVGRGDYSSVTAIACALCPATVTLLMGTKQAMGALARGKGWFYQKMGYGWVCPVCQSDNDITSLPRRYA